MRDVVAVAHGNSAIHADMQIDVKGKSHFPDQTFFHVQNSRNRNGRVS